MTGGERLLIVGGGLTGSLIALALTRLRPNADFLLIEQNGYFGGGPVAPFFPAAVPVDGHWLIEPLIVGEWPSYYVAFPQLSRDIPGRVAYLIPEQIHAEVVQTIPPERYKAGAIAIGGNEGAVQLKDGEMIRGSIVIDARGDVLAPGLASPRTHILNRVVRFDREHELDRPILVDATLSPETCTFLQYLPLDPHLLLIRYIGNAGDGGLAPPSDDGGLPDDGRIVREFVTVEPLPGLSAPSQEAPYSGWICARAARAALWHPVLASPVAGAASLAMEIGRQPWSAGDMLLTNAIARLEERASSHHQRLTSMIDTMLSDRAADRIIALRHLYGMGPEVISRFDAATSDANELEWLGEAIERARERNRSKAPEQSSSFHPEGRTEH